MSTKEIVLNWLQEKANRDKLPTKKVTKHGYEAFKQYGHVYKYDNNSTLIATLGENYFKLIIE